MIYDYIDISTKYYIVNRVRLWARTGNNGAIILQNQEIKDITEADLSVDSQDDIVWSLLYLIGVGLLRYFVKEDGRVFELGMKPHWNKPHWLRDRVSQINLNSHIDFMMELERENSQRGLEPVGLEASLDNISYRARCLAKPKPPNRDPKKEIQLVRDNRTLLAAKRAFHRG